MKPNIAVIFQCVCISAALCLFAAVPAWCQTGGQYELSWSTIDGGGGTSTGGQYKVTGTIGQPDAEYLAGGDYEIFGGFWSGGPVCFVDFYYFAKFADWWLVSGTGLPSDLDGDGNVDEDDLDRFVNYWLLSCPYKWSLAANRPDCFPRDNPAYIDWIALGRPACWCAPPFGSGYQCDGDADGKRGGRPTFYRVFSGDLRLITENWKKNTADTTLNACADIDHKAETDGYRVYTNDLNILIKNWKKKDSQLPGNCPRPE